MTLASQKNADELRGALRSLVRPVAVVTAACGGKNYAMAATAFCEVSMDPPSMLLCINRANATHEAVVQGAELCLNLLAEDQIEISRRCGGGVAPAERFDLGDWVLDDECPPRLADACASVRLRPVHVVDHSTHAVVIGEVTGVTRRDDLFPLGFHDGAYLFPSRVSR